MQHKEAKLKFYTYWRSTAAYRVRIALNYKKIAYENIFINLLKNAHKTSAFRKINLHARVPAIDDEGFLIGQSLAILEYLEAAYPSPPLLPNTKQDSAMVRYIAQIIVSDMHPLNNSSTIKYLKTNMHQSNKNINLWYSHWLTNGFNALENILKKVSKSTSFCVGEQLTIADICLIPQIYNAHKCNFDMSKYPHLMQIYRHCLTLSFINEAEPENQPDYIKSNGIPGAV